MSTRHDIARAGRYSPVPFVLLTLAATALLFAFSPAVAFAQTRDGLDVTATTVYSPDLANEDIDVTATFVMVNQQADEIVGETVRSFYYTTWIIALPASATNLTATGANSALNITVEPSEESNSVDFASISLPFNLDYQQEVTIEVTYTLPGGDPRAEGAVARVNRSFLSFPVWTSGDPGQTTVEVLVPDGFTTDIQGDLDELELITRDGQQILQATAISDPQSFFGQVYGRNDQGLLIEDADLPDATATVRAWPDDPEWAAFVVDAIEEDVPVIEDLIGIEWPAGDIEVIETVTPYLYGYGGWFNASSGQIEIGEALERDLILHELSHAWFNDELIAGRWITEGLAEEFASRTIEATSDTRPDPEEPDLSNPVRVPLAAWGSPWTLDEEDAFNYEEFHYNAAWWVMREITNDVGLDAFAEVLGSLAADEIAYRGSGPIEQTQQPTSWTHFFDLLEIQAGAQGLDDLFAEYILAPVDIARLADRRDAVEAYDGFVDAAGDWGPPLIIRRQLSAWQFAEARESIEAATKVLNMRNIADTEATKLQVVLSRGSQGPFESAMSADDLALALEREQSLVKDLEELDRRRVELQVLADERAIPLTHSEQSLANAIDEAKDQHAALLDLGEAQDQARLRSENLNLEMLAWPSSASIDTLASLAEARVAAIDAIDETTRHLAMPRQLTERIGTWRRNPDEALDQARRSFEADELTATFESLAEAERRADTAAEVGQRRLRNFAIITIVIALLFVLAIRLRPKPTNTRFKNGVTA